MVKRKKDLPPFYASLDLLPPGYANLGYDANPVAGPSAPKIESDPDFAIDVPGPSNVFLQASAPLPDLNAPRPLTLVHNPPTLDFENIYDACVRYADQHCCYGKRFVNQMKLTEINNRTVYHYRLESYGEQRDSTYHTMPFRGGSVDGADSSRRPPRLWAMTVLPPTPFQDDSVERPIPHTESVYTCTNCDGRGKSRCNSCDGRGRRDCSYCSGSGRSDDNNEACSSCNGYRTQSCTMCYGTSERTCSTCSGYKRIKKYGKLIVTWKNHSRYSLTSTDRLPAELILKAQGIELLKESAKELDPITNAAESEVNNMSAVALRAHKVSFPDERIIRQRHVLRAIPFTRAKYKWKDREGEFYIYDTDKKVYFEDYPQQCCCCTCC